jgi:large subunit ribosomal protein L10
MPNPKKTDAVKALKEKVSKAKSIILADYKGLSAEDANTLRAQLKEVDAEANVAKNTLLKIALEEEKLPVKDVEEHLKGSTMTVFSYNDPISPIKTIADFAKKLELPKIKAGFIEGAFTTGEQFEVISKLPGRDQLLGQVVGTMKSPITGFVNVLAGSQRKFVYAVSALAKKREGGVENG